MQPTKYVYIDESGTLPDRNDKYFVISAVLTDDPRSLSLIANKLRKKSDKKSLLHSEIKFYHLGENSRIGYLKLLNDAKPEIFILVVNKNNRGITDSPENYAIIVSELLDLGINISHKQIRELVFDKHFSNQNDTKEFNDYLKKYTKHDYSIKHVDSQKDHAVNSSDVVSGSVLAYKSKKNKGYLKIIRPQIKSFKTKQWTSIKRKSRRTDVNIHPSETY